MTTYVIRRLLQTVLMIFILSIIFFLLVHFNPVSPCGTQQIGCTERLHLDQPISDQYLTYMRLTLHGNFGVSNSGQPVSEVILQKLPPTVLLVAVSVVLQQLIALPLGMLASLRQYSLFDQGLTFLSYVALSIPSFVLGFVLIYLFGVKFGVLPVGHSQDEAAPLLWSGDWFAALKSDPGYLLGDALRHYLLPGFVLIVSGIAIDSRFMRAAMLQVLNEDYIRTANAKGVGRRRVIFKHAFRNAVLPIITNLALYLPSLIGGIIVVETVFTWGGLGYLFATSISGPGGVGGGFASFADFPVLQALLVLSALAVLLANLLADLAYAWLDPRIRFD